MTGPMVLADGTMTGPMVLADGTTLPPTGKKFEVDPCTVSHWKRGQIAEEILFYDAALRLPQLGIKS